MSKLSNAIGALRMGLVEAINASGLPPCVVGMVLDQVRTQVQLLEAQEDAETEEKKRRRTMALYRVQGNGKAPAGLQAGDEVVTGGGTYRILGVNADGSYRSSLSNKYQTIYNYRGSYGTPSAGQTDAAQVRTPGYTPSGAASEAKAALDRVLSEKPGSYTSRWDSELDALL